MKYSETGIKGLWVIEPQRFGDKRGYFMETFRLDEFTLATGTDVCAGCQGEFFRRGECSAASISKEAHSHRQNSSGSQWGGYST